MILIINFIPTKLHHSVRSKLSPIKRILNHNNQNKYPTKRKRIVIFNWIWKNERDELNRSNFMGQYGSYF